MLRGDVKQPSWRTSVGADAIDPLGRHRRKIPAGQVGIMVGAAVLVRAERAIGHALYVEFLVTEPKEFAVDLDSSLRLGRSGHVKPECADGILLEMLEQSTAQASRPSNASNP